VTSSAADALRQVAIKLRLPKTGSPTPATTTTWTATSRWGGSPLSCSRRSVDGPPTSSRSNSAAYATPKIDVRGMFAPDRIVLVR